MKDLQEVLGRDFGSMPLERLEHEITELAAHIHAATCRWLLMVAELDLREGWASWGSTSCAEWLSWRCGVAPGAAREQVRVARALMSLPLVRAAFGRGELSYSKARAITRVAESANEAELVELARHATAAQLERLVRGYRRARSAELEVANRAHDERFLDLSWDDDGSLIVRGRLPAEQGALLISAIDAARDALRERDSSGAAEDADVSAETSAAESATADQSRADALSLMAETLLGAGVAPLSGGERHQVVVRVDDAALRRDDEGGCAINGGPALPPETARRLACDASIVHITERAGRPLTVGRRSRAVPAALRRALQSRDGGCTFPGCERRRFVDAHHVRHWAHGGETKLSNLLLLCRHHHRLIHEGGFRLEVDRRGATTFRCPDGRLLPTRPSRGSGDPFELRHRNSRSGLAITPDTCVARSGGTGSTTTSRSAGCSHCTTEARGLPRTPNRPVASASPRRRTARGRRDNAPRDDGGAAGVATRDVRSANARGIRRIASPGRRDASGERDP